MNDKLNLQWSDSQGVFTDAHGTKCTIGKAAWVGSGHIYLMATNGAIVLSPEMCAELALVLGYIAFTEGELPSPEGEDTAPQAR